MKNTKRKIWVYSLSILGVFLMFATGCKNNAIVILPLLSTTSVSVITATSAISGGKITSDGGASVTVRGVCWSTSQTPTTANSKTTNGTGTGAFTSSITALTASTTYYVRAYATNSAGTAYGDQLNFTTSGSTGIPTLATTAITLITTTTATSGGNITSDGGTTITARGVCWSTSANPTIALSTKTTDGTGTGTGAFTSNITGLTASTVYHVRAYATNSSGTGYGTDISFTTNTVAIVPTLSTTAITLIATTTASSGGNITSDGGASVTARGICWSTSSNPVVTGSYSTNGTGTGSFVSNLTGLTVNTTYYVRAYATNSQGTGYGNTLTFTTSAMSIKLFNVGDFPVINNIIESSSGNILITGTQDNQQSVYVLKLDAAGNQVWNKYYSAGTWVDGNHIFEVSSHGYLVTGTIDATQGSLFKMHLDESGTPSGTSYFDDNLWTGSFDEVQLPDGSIVFAGNTQVKDNGTTFIPYGDALITGINTSGIQYFRTNYNYAIGNSDCFFAIVSTSDGGFAAAGSTNVYDNGSGYGGPDDAILVKTNALGNISWAKNFGYQTNDGANGGAIDLIQLSNGDYAILCHFGRNYKMYIIITDSNGNLKRATNIEGYTGQQFVEAADGGLVIVGQNSTSNGVVVKVNSSGAKVWEYNAEYHPTAIVKSSDGKYLLAGDAEVSFGVYKTFVLKLDDVGKRIW